MIAVILLDTSGSMAELSGSRRRIDLLQDVFDAVLPSVPGAHVIGFNTIPTLLVRGARLPEPVGGTAMHLALLEAEKLRPSSVVVVSDGQPDDPNAALAAAQRLRCRICSYFVGDERDHAATAFLRA